MDFLARIVNESFEKWALGLTHILLKGVVPCKPLFKSFNFLSSGAILAFITCPLRACVLSHAFSEKFDVMEKQILCYFCL